jgi:hypothetical protein
MDTAAKLDSPMSADMPAGGATATKQMVGAFRNAGDFHRGSGSATVYQAADGT